MEKRSRRDDEPDDDYNPPAIPMGPDGPIDALGHPPAVPERIPENFVCLRGPCRHYWTLVTMAQEGNPAETWEHLGIDAPRRHHHLCLVNPGYETAFEDDNAYECSRWDPLEPRELVQLNRRRRRYYERASKDLDKHFESPRSWWRRLFRI